MGPPVVKAGAAPPDSSSRRFGDGSVEDAAAHRPAQGRPLLPREHGAYAGIVFPLVTALLLGRPNPAQLLWVAGCVAVFLAHEPLLIMVGERGRRSHSEMGARARKTAQVLAAFAVVAGGLGWWLAPAAARLALILPLALGALLLRFILSHRERSLAGELLACLTLSSTLLPVALAGGVSLRAALIAASMWCAASCLATLTVRATIARAKQMADHRRLSCATVAFGAAAALAALWLALTNFMPALAAGAILPFVLVALACSVVRVHPRHLRAMGWSLVGSNVITLMALLVGLR
jgi:hypothetical protein